jgi:hypothetical protein
MVGRRRRQNEHGRKQAAVCDRGGSIHHAVQTHETLVGGLGIVPGFRAGSVRVVQLVDP